MTVDFPTQEYIKYLEIIGCNEDTLTDVKLKEIFKLAYESFKNKSITIASFCAIGEYLFYKIKDETEKMSKFASTLLDCSELVYYIQINDDDSEEFDNVYSRIEGYFSEV